MFCQTEFSGTQCVPKGLEVGRKTTTCRGCISLSDVASGETCVVWAGEFHPGPNPKPDLQVSKHPAFPIVLITWRRFSAYGTPGKESGDSISSWPVHSWRSRVRV
jgi:hypothetical protein